MTTLPLGFRISKIQIEYQLEKSGESSYMGRKDNLSGDTVTEEVTSEHRKPRDRGRW